MVLLAMQILLVYVTRLIWIGRIAFREWDLCKDWLDLLDWRRYVVVWWRIWNII